MLSRTQQKALKRIVGEGRFLTDEAARSVYAFDASGLSGTALAVCFPKTTEEISKLLAFCHNDGIPVYPRGAGSGRTGGAVPTVPGIVVSLERMNRVIEVSQKDMLTVVEPGVITGDLQGLVMRHGLFYPPDPASLSFCTIGGNVATCAGGPKAVKYGVTRDYLLGLEAVRADGSVLTLGGRTVKASSGYSLKDLMCGSEGTLSIFSRITLRLIPRPVAEGVMFACFSSPEGAAHAALEIFSMGLVPRTCEFMDRTCSRLVTREGGFPVDQETLGAMLILESDGSPGSVADELDAMKVACQKAGSFYSKVAESCEESNTIWSLRRTLSQRVRQLGYPNKVSEDIVVPRGRLPEIVGRLEAIERHFGIKIVSFGHLGDGNLHVNVLYHGDRENELIDEVIDSIFRETLKLSGRVSGEHGIGLTKRKYLTWELDVVTLGTMRGIKDLFDPKAILNPGKVF